MKCEEIEELLSEYIENELSPEVHDEVARHLEKCLMCQMVKEQMEELMFSVPDLEEDVPFFLKNRLYYIPESQDNLIQLETNRYYMKWVAAVIGTFILFLNIFYFTNVYPPANRLLHSVVSELETLAVKTEAIYERVKGSQAVFPLAEEDEGHGEDEFSMEKNIDENAGQDSDRNSDGDSDKNTGNNGGKNG